MGRVAGRAFPATQDSYTRNFTTAVATPSAGVNAADNTLTVGSTAGFLPGGGKVKVDTEIIRYAG